MFIRTQKCFRPTTTLHSRNTIISLGTTEMPGGSKKKNSKASTDRFCSQQTVSYRQKQAMPTVFTQPAQPDTPASSIFLIGQMAARRTSLKLLSMQKDCRLRHKLKKAPSSAVLPTIKWCSWL